MNDQRVLSRDQGHTSAPPHHAAPCGEAAAPLGSSTLGDFEIVREIGRGGTALVYEARQTSLGRNVALKRLPSAAVFDRRWLERFRNEVRTAAQLSHAHIVPFYELGQDAHFYTMQLVDGISLAEVIQHLRQCRVGDGRAPRPCQRPKPDGPHSALLKLCERCRCRLARGDRAAVPKAGNAAESMSERVDLIASARYHRAVAQWVRDAALALDYAHNQAILHLDVKPSNLLVDGNGKLWMTDFGASRTTSGNGSSTTDGLVGTLCYMSPEQALGRAELLDRRSDVYSLGATLYELLTLEPPFADAAPPGLLTQVTLGRARPPRQVNSALASELNAIVVKAMAAEPDQRYATARDMADDLEKYLSATAEMELADSNDPRSVAPRRRHRFARFMPAITLVCLAMLATAPVRSHPLRPVHPWNGHFYMLTSTRTDWLSGETEAVARGGHLITINDAAEQEFVVATFLSPPDQTYWIGLTDQEQEGTWRWISGEPLEYANWQAGEPNNVKHMDPVTGHLPGEHHGVINWHLIYDPSRARIGSWNDYTSIPNHELLPGFHGIMEFASDPR